MVSKSDPVKVAVEILDKFSDDLEKLEKQLDRIDGKKLDVTLDIDDNGSIERTKAQLKALEKKITTKLNINLDGVGKAVALKSMLGGDTESTHHVNVDYRGIPDGVGASLERLFGRPGSLGDPGNEFLMNIGDATDRASRAVGGDGGIPDVVEAPFRGGPQLKADLAADRKRNRRRNGIRAIRRGIGGVMRGIGGGIRSAGAFFSEMDMGEVTGPVQKTMKTLAKFRPTIMMWWQLIALLIPMMIALAGAALGVVSAFAGIAVAGAAIVGLGLLGYGDTLTESLEEAKRRVGELKKELFGVFRPVGTAFQPILDNLFDTAPTQAQRLVDPLMRLTAFDGFFSSSMAGVFGWVGDLIDAIADLDTEIMAIGSSFGRIIGDTLLTLLRWSVKEVYNNQEAYMKLGKILGDVIFVIFLLSRAVSFAISTFQPLFDIIVMVTEWLSNKYLAAILAGVMGGLLLAGALWAVFGALSAIAGSAVAGVIWGLVTGAWSLTAVLGVVLVKLYMIISALSTIHLLTGAAFVLGALAVGKLAYDEFNSGRPQASGGAGGGGNTIIVNGDVRNREYQKMKSDFPGLFEEESSVSDGRSK